MKPKVTDLVVGIVATLAAGQLEVMLVDASLVVGLLAIGVPLVLMASHLRDLRQN